MSGSSTLAWALATVAFASNIQAAGPALDTAAIEAATGLKGTYSQTENVFKLTSSPP